MPQRSPLLICHRCPSRGPLTGQSIPCTVDGRDITFHAADYACPLGRFPSRGAGDDVAAALDAFGVGRLAKAVIGRVTGRPCGCAGRQAAMNRIFPARK